MVVARVPVSPMARQDPVVTASSVWDTGGSLVKCNCNRQTALATGTTTEGGGDS